MSKIAHSTKKGPGRKHSQGKRDYLPAEPESKFIPHCAKRKAK